MGVSLVRYQRSETGYFIIYLCGLIISEARVWGLRVGFGVWGLRVWGVGFEGWRFSVII